MFHSEPTVLNRSSLEKGKLLVHVVSRVINPEVKEAVFCQLRFGTAQDNVGAVVIRHHYCPRMDMLLDDVYEVVVTLAHNFVYDCDARTSAIQPKAPPYLFRKAASKMPSLSRDFGFIDFNNARENEIGLYVGLPIVGVRLAKKKEHRYELISTAAHVAREDGSCVLDPHVQCEAE